MVQQVREATPQIQRIAQGLGEMDALLSLAEVAERNGYTRPVLDEGSRLRIVEGRHPVLERMALDER
ncbi:MAG: hypothetical protein NTY64_19625, partial [Deltaproteobacteria bacterium]|nr:hypothetical protein [Deltaproteobacteria bacterium]